MPNYAVIFYEPVAGKRSFVKGPEADQSFLAETPSAACALASVQERKSGLFSAALISAFSTFDETFGFSATGSGSSWNPQVMGLSNFPDGGTPDADDTQIFDGGTP